MPDAELNVLGAELARKQEGLSGPQLTGGLPAELPPDPALVIVLFLVAIGSLGLGIAFKGGRFQRALKWYWDPNEPWYIRNFPFALLPGSLAALSFSIVLTIAPMISNEGFYNAFLRGGLLLGITFGLLMFHSMWRPPNILKPRWLRVHEQTCPPPAHGPAGGWGIVDRFLYIFFMGVGVFAAMAVAVGMLQPFLR